MSSLTSSPWKQGQGRVTVMPDSPLTAGQGFAMMELRMDQLSKKMDAVLDEVRSWRDAPRPSQRVNAMPVVMTPQRLVQPKENEPKTSHARPSMASNVSEQVNAQQLSVQSVRQMDLGNAFRFYAKEISHELPELEIESNISDEDKQHTGVLRMVRRTRLDMIWETLDDPNSSHKAWWISQFQSWLVMATVIFGTLQATEPPVLNPVTVAVVETCFDSVFCLEFVFRIISAPSKWIYLTDPVNLADIACVLGLPLRASIGFVFPPEPTTYEEVVEMILVFFLPLFRFLKLLRYFEITRLLIDACAKSAEAVPVLSYMMALIVLISATFIYLFEDRSNIPSMPHSLWLAVVTMTTVGYGDYYPTSIGGYLTVAGLTFVSVVFLALPVGIIGHEFNKSWQSRGHMLLMTRVRKCLNKWGFNAGDVQILIRYADTDGDGKLTLAEFVELIRQMRIGVSSEAAAELFTMLDTDYNGYVDDDEFLRNVFPDEYVKELQRAQRQALPECKQKINEALERLDSMRSGALASMASATLGRMESELSGVAESEASEEPAEKLNAEGF